MPSFDAEDVKRAFEATAPRRRRSLFWYFVIGLGLSMLFIPAIQGEDLGLPDGVVIVIPAAFALGIMGGVAAATRRRRQQRDFVVRSWDHVRLGEFEQAEAIAADGLTRPISAPSDRCHAFLALAAIAERRRDFDTAVQIYQHLLINRIGDPFQLQQVQIAFTSAKLQNEELTDGIQLLDRLEKVQMPLSLRAGVAIVRLYQQVFMGQFEDAVRDLDEIRALFRRFLSTRAGYAYALIAKAQHHLGRPELAAEYWRNATLLIAPERLVEQYPFLQPVASTYPAEERPV